MDPKNILRKSVDFSVQSIYRKARLLISIGTILVFAGCSYEQLSVEMEIHGKTMKRRVTCRRFKSDGGGLESVSDKTRMALAAIYPKDLSKPGKLEKVFEGEFVGRTPDEVFTTGFVLFWETNMGSLTMYTERLRNFDDPQEIVNEIYESVDRVTDFLIDWLKSEMGNSPQFPRFKVALDSRFRTDLKKAAFVYCMSGFDTKDRKQEDSQISVIQFFLEKRYITQDDLPLLFQVLGGTMDGGKLGEVIRRVLLKIADAEDNQKAAEALRFLEGRTGAAKSLTAYLLTQPKYKTLLDETDEAETNATASPRAVWELILFGDFGGKLGVVRPRLDFQLKRPVMPLLTNGSWDEKSSTVRWTGKSPERQDSPSPIYAVWVTSNDAFQQSHFGKSFLSSDSLSEYVLWRSALSESNGKEWDAFLISLKPDADIAAEIYEFEFSIHGTEDLKEANEFAVLPGKVILSKALEARAIKSEE